MPHIRIRSVENKIVQELSASLVPELAKVIQTAEDNFTIESINSQFFIGGKATDSFPFVEVLWFARSQEVQDQAATVITNQIRDLTKAPDVIVVFQVLEKSAYYENGRHF